MQPWHCDDLISEDGIENAPNDWNTNKCLGPNLVQKVVKVAWTHIVSGRLLSSDGNDNDIDDQRYMSCRSDNKEILVVDNFSGQDTETETDKISELNTTALVAQQYRVYSTKLAFLLSR